MANLQDLQNQLAELEAEIRSVKEKKDYEAAKAESEKTPEEKQAEIAGHLEMLIEAKKVELAELKK